MKKARLGRWHNSEFGIVIVFPVVEMKKARLGRWHITHVNPAPSNMTSSRNEESPFRALTHAKMCEAADSAKAIVEMKKARLGRWHFFDFFNLVVLHFNCRNEESPFRALTHSCFDCYFSVKFQVEMKKARLGRWHT